MKIYLHKFLGYLLISLALALTFGPFGGNPFAKKYDPIQREKFCQHYPQSCESMEEDNSDKLIVSDSTLTYLKYPLGSILLLLGIVALRKSYKHQAGIRINTNTIAIIEDIISIFFLSLAAYGVWASLLHHMAGAKIYLYDYDGDALALNIAAFFFIPATAIMALFVSNATGQSIEIDNAGITIHYPGSSESMLWNKIIHLKTADDFIAVERAGVPIPEKMQTKLLIESKTNTMELFEPGLKKTKNNIITQLQQFAPDHLKDDIVRLAKKWSLLKGE